MEKRRHHTGRIAALVATAAVALPLAVSCSRPETDSAPRDADLVRVGDTTLTLHDVMARIPAGLAPADSAALFASIVETWTQEQLLREVARENAIDLERIDRMTADYRNRLIVNEYIHLMQRSRSKAVDESQVKSYFETHADEMKLDRPLVKGLYIKLANNADRLDDVRRWVRSASKTSVDNIDKYGLAGAAEYEYFLDRWIDWEDIATQIPHRFGDAGEFLAAHRDFETTDGKSTYLLHIEEVLPAGSKMPYDFAAPRIRESMLQYNRAGYGRDLMHEFAVKARRDGVLDTPGYDLMEHKMIPRNKAKAK